MPLTILAVTKVLVCSASLICASIVDLKTREVSNWLWIVTYPLGLALTFCDRNNVFLLVVSVTITITLGVALFYLNLSGGADVKALIMVSICSFLLIRV